MFRTTGRWAVITTIGATLFALPNAAFAGDKDRSVMAGDPTDTKSLKRAQVGFIVIEPVSGTEITPETDCVLRVYRANRAEYKRGADGSGTIETKDSPKIHIPPPPRSVPFDPINTEGKPARHFDYSRVESVMQAAFGVENGDNAVAVFDFLSRKRGEKKDSQVVMELPGTFRVGGLLGQKLAEEEYRLAEQAELRTKGNSSRSPAVNVVPPINERAGATPTATQTAKSGVIH